MESQWIGHMLETDDGALSCLIDIGYAESCPDEERPLFTMVRFPFQEPGEHGFGSEEERGAIGDVEDTIAQKGEKHGVVHVASVRGGGNLDALFYSPAGAKAHLQSILKDARQGLRGRGGLTQRPAVGAVPGPVPAR